jgi:hypothetical protein
MIRLRRLNFFNSISESPDFNFTALSSSTDKDFLMNFEELFPLTWISLTGKDLLLIVISGLDKVIFESDTLSRFAYCDLER